MSDPGSEGLESSGREDAYDAEVGDEQIKSDDEEYVDEVEEVKTTKPRRGGSRREQSKRSKRALVDEEDADFEEVIPSKKRIKVSKTVPDEDDEEDLIDEQKVEPGFEDPVSESQDESEKIEHMDDEEEDDGFNDASSTQPSRLQDDEDDEEEARQDAQDSLKSPSKSKMLRSLLGNDQGRKTPTEEEVQLKRAENARKRKNLSEKRSEEEKQETINKLLRRRAGKSRSHLPTEDEAREGTADNSAFGKPRRPYDSTGMTRTIRSYKEDIYCTVPQHQS